MIRPVTLDPSAAIPPNTFYLTNVKIVKVALYALAVLCTIGAVATLTEHLIIPMSLPCHPATALIALAILCVGLARRIKDYKDPIELHKIQVAAMSLKYSQVIQIHGVENMVLYKILPENIDGEDFCSCFQKLSTESLALREEDKAKLKEFKLFIYGTKSVQGSLGEVYEQAIAGHVRRFKEWVLERS
jgi:hypothetical protein